MISCHPTEFTSLVTGARKHKLNLQWTVYHGSDSMHADYSLVKSSTMRCLSPSGALVMPHIKAVTTENSFSEEIRPQLCNSVIGITKTITWVTYSVNAYRNFRRKLKFAQHSNQTAAFDDRQKFMRHATGTGSSFQPMKQNTALALAGRGSGRRRKARTTRDSDRMLGAFKSC